MNHPIPSDPVLAHARSSIDARAAVGLNRIGNSVAQFALITESVNANAGEFREFVEGLDDVLALRLMAHASTTNVVIRLAQTAGQLAAIAQTLVEASQKLRSQQDRVYSAAKDRLEQDR